ncbi:MAG: ABC transporter substrate-binding protein [Acidimicrobiales bacterium]|nr:ABC transporter substrate-binding protein [Acidimicrobiales bacterium]
MPATTSVVRRRHELAAARCGPDHQAVDQGESEVGNVQGSGGNSGRLNRRTFLSRSAAAGGAVALGATAGGVLSACGSSGGASPTTSGPTPTGTKAGINTTNPVRGGSVNFGTAAEIDGFYPPLNHWDTNGFLYAHSVFDPYMAVAADGTVKPYLAQSLTPNANMDVWTMTLRPGVKFHDGSPLDSSVVVANYNELKNSALTGVVFQRVQSVTATGPMTVEYQLADSYPAFPAAFTSQIGHPFALSMINQAKSGSSGTIIPVGTGPFVYSDWQVNSHFTATRNPHYWQPNYPYLDQITFKPIPDDTQREATLRTGGIDVMLTANPYAIGRFSGSGGGGFTQVNSLGDVIGQPTLGFIMLNCVVAPTKDVELRRAIAMATNQAEIIKLFNNNYGQVYNGLYPKGSPYYSPDTGYPAYNPSGAQEAIAHYKASGGDPTFQLLTVPDPRDVSITEALQQMWNSAGMNVSVAQTEQATIIDDFVLGKFQAVTSYQFGAVDPSLNYVWFSTTTIKPLGQLSINFTRNDDPALEQAISTGRSTLDPSTRVAAYQEANKRLGADVPYVWLGQQLFTDVAQDRVQNYAGLTLPDGSAGYGFDEGVTFPSQMWLSR